MIKKVSGPLILVRYAHLILDLEDDVLYTPAEVVQTKYGHKGSRSPEYQRFNRYRNAIWGFGNRCGLGSHSCDNAKRDENGKIIMRKVNANGVEKAVLQEGERYPKAYGKTWREFLDPRERELPSILQNLHDILSQELDHRRANEIRESRVEAGSSETKEHKIQDAQESQHRDTKDDSNLMDVATTSAHTSELPTSSNTPPSPPNVSPIELPLEFSQSSVGSDTLRDSEDGNTLAVTKAEGGLVVPPLVDPVEDPEIVTNDPINLEPMSANPTPERNRAGVIPDPMSTESAKAVVIPPVSLFQSSARPGRNFFLALVAMLVLGMVGVFECHISQSRGGQVDYASRVVPWTNLAENHVSHFEKPDRSFFVETITTESDDSSQGELPPLLATEEPPLYLGYVSVGNLQDE